MDFLAHIGAQAPPDTNDSAALTELMDAGLVAERARDKPRDYLGGSRLGVECDRALFYEYTHAKKDPDREFSGRMLRIFERGHTAEERMAKYLRLAGFDLVTHGPDGRQFGFGVAPHPETGRPRIAGHLDGAIKGWKPPAGVSAAAATWASTLPFPMLWESKALKASSFTELASKGLMRSKPIYWVQVHTYMAHMQLGHCLFTAECQDTCQIFGQVIKFDRATAQTGSDRGVRVIQARAAAELARVSRDRSDYRCRLCDYQETCWAEPHAPVALTGKPIAPGWGAWGKDAS